MKHFFGIIITALVFCIGLSAMPSDVAFADEIAETFVIADFNIEETYNNVQMIQRLGKDENIHLSGTQSAKYILNGGGTGVSYFLTEDKRNFTSFDTLNFWAYNDGYGASDFDATKMFCIVLRSDGSTAWLNNLLYKEIKIDWTGWKKFSVSLRGFNTIGTVNMQNITDIQLRPGKLNATPVNDYWDEIYFDSFWLSQADNGHVWADMTSENTVKNYKTLSGQNIAFELDDTKYLSETSGKWLYSKPVGQVTVLYNNQANPIDVRNYNCAVFDIHSDIDTSLTASPEMIYIYAYPMDGSGAWFQYPITIDWVGWKHFAVSLAEFEKKGAEPGTWNDIKGLRLAVNKENPDVTLRFDRIMFTEEIPSEIQLVNSSIADGEKNAGVTNTFITLDFNNVLSGFLSQDSIKILKNDTQVNDFVFGSYGNSVRIYLNSLENNSEYKIIINGVTDRYGSIINEDVNITFKTERTEEEKKFVLELNDAQSGEDVLNIISSNAYEDIFDTSESAGLAKHISDVIYENLPYEDFDNIIETAQKAQKMLDELNICDSTSLTEFLEENEAFVLNEISEYDKYKQLSSRDLFKINKLIVQENDFSSFTEFREKLKTVINSYETEKEEEKKTSNISGGGGGGGRTIKVPSVVPNITKPEAAKPEPIIFTDLGNFAWAEEAVKELHKNGIISKDADSLFRPDKNVRRSEFVKMLVLSLGLKDDNAACIFSDVDKDSWYYLYAASAYKNGIIQGNDNNLFNPDDFISRQDAALMIYRALELNKMTLTSENGKDPVDIEQTSDYAKAAVSYIAKAKIITGNQNSEFCPKNNASRAEAAKIIYELTKVMRGAGI